MQRLGFLFSSERVSDFSLRSRAIGPSDFFMWVPVLGSFDKLREVGVLSYLFYSLFKCFVMLLLV